MRHASPILILLASAAMAACATDGGPNMPQTTLAQAAADPCRTDQPLYELSDPRAEDVFGCANARNLRLMVADPRDLERGATLPAPYGDAATQPAARHRVREPARLPAATSGGASSTGAGSEGQ
jgi:type IV pilus biogenesis protein CpaD/CtpE